MSLSGSRRPRIVIYGVGQYGGYVTRFAVQKEWTSVAAFNRAGPKVGQDLGRVAGVGRNLGVVIQDCDTGNYGALKGKADIGVVAQANVLRQNMAAYQRLMNAGLNAICHGAQSYHSFGNMPKRQPRSTHWQSRMVSASQGRASGICRASGLTSWYSAHARRLRPYITAASLTRWCK